MVSVHSWDAEFLYKTILFTNFYVSGSQSLHIWKNHWIFCLIFAGIKTKTIQSSLYSTAFFKILKEPALVQKPTIPHMKALIFSYLEPEGWGCGIIMGVPRPPPVKVIATFLSEVVEASRVNLKKKISWMYRYHFYDLKVHFWWPNKRFVWLKASLKTLYRKPVFSRRFLLQFSDLSKK